jgi:hypothetical protein
MSFFALYIFLIYLQLFLLFLIGVPLQQTILKTKNRPFMADFNNVSFDFN